MEEVTFEVSGVDGALSTVSAQVCETAAGPIRVVSLLREDGSVAARLVGVREIGVLLGYSKGGYNLYQHLLDNPDLAGYSEPVRGRRRGSEVLVERGDGVYLHRGLLGGYLDLFSDDLGWGEKRRLEFLHLDTAGTIVAGLLHRKGAATLSVALHALAKELKEGDKARAAEEAAWQEAVMSAEEAGQIVMGVVREEAKDNAAWEAWGLQTTPIHPSIIIEDARLPPPGELEAEAARLADLLQAARAMKEAEVAQQEEACVSVDVEGAVALLRAAAGAQGRPKREAWEASVRKQVNRRNVSAAMSGRDRIDALIATSDVLCRLHNADLLEDHDGLREAAECIKDALLFEAGIYRNPPLPMEGPIPADVLDEDAAWSEGHASAAEVAPRVATAGDAVSTDAAPFKISAESVQKAMLEEVVQRAFEPVLASIAGVVEAAQEMLAALQATHGVFERIEAAERALKALGTTQAEQLEHMKRLSAAMTLPSTPASESDPTERRWTALMISKTLKRDFPGRHTPSAQHIGGVADRIGVKRAPLAVAKPILINTAKGQVERQEWHYNLAAVMRIVSELGYGDVARRETFAGAEVEQ